MRTSSPALARRLGTAALALSIFVSTAGAQTSRTTPLAQAQDETERSEDPPQWTARPLFGETHVYVLPKGTTAFVFELRPIAPRSGLTVTESAYRAEFGLPGRVQLGVRAAGRTETSQDVIGNIDAQALEIRWGLAAWGRAWGNPTLQAEWREASRGADAATITLLLGGGAGTGWRWGTNLAWAQEAGGAQEITRAWIAGIGYESSRVASFGVETRVGFVDRLASDGRSRTAMSREVLVGPSLQIRPARRMYINLLPLLGGTGSSPRARTTLLAGWQF